MAPRTQPRGARGVRSKGPGEEDIRRAAAGDQAALERVFAQMKGTVDRLARGREGGVLPREDLVQEGSVGLMAAISSFPSGGADFARHAEDAIAGQMDAALAEEAATQEADRRFVADAEAYQRADFELRRDLERPPTQLEIATRLEWPVEHVSRVVEAVAEARRQYDEEILGYIDPQDVNVDGEDGDEGEDGR